mmetsp:Transcript_3069/g.12670  ORF Transcript_3069/g.12670 Transcript_3069/m.12670 type:complete len:207 (+) Transcript_3069:1873-2493(+)
MLGCGSGCCSWQQRRACAPARCLASAPPPCGGLCGESSTPRRQRPLPPPQPLRAQTTLPGALDAGLLRALRTLRRGCGRRRGGARACGRRLCCVSPRAGTSCGDWRRRWQRRPRRPRRRATPRRKPTRQQKCPPGTSAGRPAGWSGALCSPHRARKRRPREPLRQAARRVATVQQPCSRPPLRGATRFWFGVQAPTGHGASRQAAG